MVGMYVARVPNRNSPPAYLIRESYREGGKVKTRTIANITRLGGEKIALVRKVLAGQDLVAVDQAFQIRRSLPHGHVAAVLGTLKGIGLPGILDPRPSPQRELAVAMIVARVLDPASKLATARGLAPETAASSLGQVLELGAVDEDDLYQALDWLVERQDRIERRLARRTLENGSLVLYDVSSTWVEGRHCDLAAFGKSRDDKKGKMQIIFGLMCAPDGCPVAVEVFEGNTGDPKTLARQIDKLKQRFGLARVVLVGDRGMLTQARLDGDVKPAGLDWITALRAPAIQALAAEGGPLQLSLFDRQDMAEITAPAFPGERLIVCRNPLLAEERRRKRKDLLAATETNLEKIAAACRRRRRPLRGAGEIGKRVGVVLAKHKMGKHFRTVIAEDGLSFERDQASIAREAALDGFYVLRTSLPAEALDGARVVSAYKSLAMVERAFRSMKTVDLHVRPIFHRRDRRVRGHLLLCMLAYLVVWHMRARLAPMLFDDDDPKAAAAGRASPVAPAVRSPAALDKAARRRTADGLPVHSFRSLLSDLATLSRNTVAAHGDGAGESACTFTTYTVPTPVQKRAFELLGVKHIL